MRNYICFLAVVLSGYRTPNGMNIGSFGPANFSISDLLHISFIPPLFCGDSAMIRISVRSKRISCTCSENRSDTCAVEQTFEEVAFTKMVQRRNFKNAAWNSLLHILLLFFNYIALVIRRPSCTICQFWLFAGQCKSIADQRNYHIFLKAKWRFAWVMSLISTNQTTYESYG